MPVRSRFALPLALALSGASLAMAPTAGAQRSTLAPDSVSATQPVAAQQAATPAAPVGPTIDAASVAVRHAPAADAPQARRAGYGQPVALMVVGGAAVLVGLIIGGGAGTAIAIGGAVAGLVGLYQYLQ
jgi:predicted methyltransferase